MRIVSWNVNGLRKLRPLEKLFESLDADIICFQETRVSGDYDSHLESLAFVKGYDSFFSICKQKRGYSGVATFCRKGSATPTDAGEGLNSDTGGAKLISNENGTYGDCIQRECPCEVKGCLEESLVLVRNEGRCVITDHQLFVLINVYIPAVSVEGRVAFKMQFLHALRAKIDALHAKGRRVVVVGDFNICPAVIDVAEPIPPSLLTSWEQRPSRQWLLGMLAPGGPNLVDTFREVYPAVKTAYTCWSEATRARENNHGVRIDLILMDRDLFSGSVTTAGVHADVHGSDHCPVSVTLTYPANLYQVPKEPPQFCTAYMSRFCFRQQSLKEMFAQRSGMDKTDPITLRPLRPAHIQHSGVRQFGGALKKRHSTGSGAMKTKVRTGKPQRTQATLSKFFTSQESPLFDVNANVKTPGHVNGDEDTGLQINAKSVRHDDVRRKKETTEAWRKLLTGPPPPPLCRHGKPCVLKTVGKTGENRGRTFFSCPYPAGIGKSANCNFFKWAPFKAGMQTLPK